MKLLRDWLLPLALAFIVVNPAWAACPGCCSSHGGISQSCGIGGRVMCKDGTTSPTCSCSSCGVASAPVCTAKTDQRTRACPTGQVGTISESRNYSCLLGGMWSDWAVTSNTCTAASAGGGSGGGAPLGALTVIEFRNSATNHYFVTASAGEAAAIDAGSAGPGWARTGNTFHVWPDNANVSGTVPVCRFYAAGPNSHFFTGQEGECQWLRQLEAERRPAAVSENKAYLDWGYEGIAFRIKTPDSDSGCPAGTQEIHRLYNNRHAQNDHNHRFSPLVSDVDLLEKQGWLYEGVAMCGAK